VGITLPFIFGRSLFSATGVLSGSTFPRPGSSHWVSTAMGPSQHELVAAERSDPTLHPCICLAGSRAGRCPPLLTLQPFSPPTPLFLTLVGVSIRFTLWPAASANRNRLWNYRVNLSFFRLPAALLSLGSSSPSAGSFFPSNVEDGTSLFHFQGTWGQVLPLWWPREEAWRNVPRFSEKVLDPAVHSEFVRCASRVGYFSSLLSSCFSLWNFTQSLLLVVLKTVPPMIVKKENISLINNCYNCKAVGIKLNWKMPQKCIPAWSLH